MRFCRLLQQRQLVIGVAIGVIFGLLAVILLCPAMTSGVAHAKQRTCQHAAWLLRVGPTISLVTILERLPHMPQPLRLQEYPLLVFVPPRAFSA